MPTIRAYDAERDRDAIIRVWREVHWITSDDQAKWAPQFFETSRTDVAEVNGEVECQASSTDGTFRYLDEDLSMSAIVGVTTSRIARKQGLAQRVTAHRIAADAAEGVDICALTMFEQGFYELMGFGTGPYMHTVRFDPADLLVDRLFRVPRRLKADDWAMVHSAMMNRRLTHGGCRLNSAALLQVELNHAEKSFALGYCDGPGGELTHFFWASDHEEHGPCYIYLMAYQDHDQFLELLALIKSLGDQIRLFQMKEPSDIQLQDLIKQPFRARMVSDKGPFNTLIRGDGYWQARICDLEACMAKTHLDGPSTRFNLTLHDPIEQFIDADAPWRGVSGDFVVTLGPESCAEKGSASELPTLAASVGAFTRMWLGVRPATGLAVTDDLDGPPELLSSLDRTLRLPVPSSIGWEF